MPLIAASAGDKIELVVARTSRVFQLRPGSQVMKICIAKSAHVLRNCSGSKEIEERRLSGGRVPSGDYGERRVERVAVDAEYQSSSPKFDEL